MAVVALEGFDHLSAAQMSIKWTGNAFGSVQTARLGSGQSMRIGASATPSTRALPSTYSTLYLGIAVKFNAPFGATTEYIALRGAGANIIRIRAVVSGANQVFAILNSAGTTLATGTTALSTGQWYYVEVKCFVNASTGTTELRLNGLSTAECSSTGSNTGSTNIDSIGLAGAGGITADFDDMYCVDTSGSAPTNTWLGDSRVETLAPTGNGANTAWTGAFGDVDDSTAHDVDATFISSATPGDRETYSLSDLSVGTGTVFAVQTNLIARKDDAGARTVAPVLRISSTNYDGTTTAGLTTTYNDYMQVYDRVDPAGSAWSLSTVNAMEAGVKEVT